MDIEICYIEEQYRQSDPMFLKVLSDIRENKSSRDTYEILQTRLNKSVNANIKPTKLHTHNVDVDAYNLFELNRLPGQEISYEMQSEGNPHLAEELKKGCLANEILNLKTGAIVMFIKNNFKRKYVNGTLGKVVGFDEDDGYPIVETISGDSVIAYPESWTIENDDKILAKISQVPLRLAWAITVHKSQGMSLDCAEIDLSKTFEYGMGYVALSRVRSLSGIKLIGINELAFMVNDNAVELDGEFRRKSTKTLEKFNELKKKLVKKKQKEFLKSCRNNEEFAAKGKI
jgi:ATP-dependent exoDNAse (exonuclease V) alpha subunit